MPYIIAVLAIVILGVGFTLLQSNTSPNPAETTLAVETKSPTNQVAPDTTTPATNETPQTIHDYRDGTYEMTVTYQTPMRAEYSLDVSLTVVKDIVTGAGIVYSNGAEKDPNAQKFEAAYRTEVIGKDIDALNISRVGGASLTTAAFNNALIAIKTNAKS